jgi:hypothetical protein
MLLGADTAANCGQCAVLIDDLICTLKVALGALCDELRDMYGYGAALGARTGLAVQAAGSLIQSLLLGVAQSNFLEVLISYIRLLRGHRISGHRHVGHLISPPS